MLKQQTLYKGRFDIEHVRDGIVIDRFSFFNDTTLLGKNKMLDCMFNGASGISNWYIGYIDNSTFSAVDESDTYTSHAGWSELTSYTSATRLAWTKGAAATKAVTNASPITYTFNADCSAVGMFLASSSVKGETTGSALLWCTALFGSVRNFTSGDTHNITYTASLL